jgi:hypothetical protein
LARAQPPKNRFIYIFIYSIIPLLYNTMARIKSRKSRARHYTPPPELFQSSGKHPQTPSRCGVIFARLYSQELGIPIPSSIVRKVTGIAPRGQTRILSSKQPRTFHNRPDSEPETRGPKRVLTRSETAVIADYLDDETVPLDDRGAPWQDITEAAGVILPKTQHLKPAGLRTITSQSIQRACRHDENIINAVCEEEKELDEKQARPRRLFAEEQLKIRPRSDQWNDVAFCDELHLGIRPQVTKHVKRRRGKGSREKLCNVHFKKVTSKDTKARQERKNICL